MQQPLNPANGAAGAIPALLEELRLAFEANSQDVTSSLLPGIPQTELIGRCKWFPADLPAEIIAMYSWRNGQRDVVLEKESPYWFRDNVFIPVEYAEREYKSMMETYGLYSNPEFDGVDLKYCFPFAAYQGSWYVFPCHGQMMSSLVDRPVVRVFQGIDIFYNSVECMIRTSIDWVRDPLRRERGAQRQERWTQIWEQCNPGIRQIRAR